MQQMMTSKRMQEDRPAGRETTDDFYRTAFT
jgi:hypothetical protein